MTRRWLIVPAIGVRLSSLEGAYRACDSSMDSTSVNTGVRRRDRRSGLTHSPEHSQATYPDQREEQVGREGEAQDHVSHPHAATRGDIIKRWKTSVPISSARTVRP